MTEHEKFGMTLTEAVKAVNEAGFTLNIERKSSNDETVGWFHAGDGMYEVTKNIDGIDGYAIQGLAGTVVPSPMTNTEEVHEGLHDLDAKEEKEYVDYSQLQPSNNQ